MDLQRLDKITSSQLNISRSAAKSAIRGGKVSVDGNIIRDPSFAVDPTACKIMFDGQAVVYKKHIYLIMNKPKGVLSSSNDRRRQTVVDLVPPNLKRAGLFPVGRLDRDTTGLLIITDDGDFAHTAISPKSGIIKTYDVVLDGEITPDAQDRFNKGVVLADGTKCRPASLQIIAFNRALVRISEGKYHQIKRMFGTVGLGVNELSRIAFGGLKLPADLKLGECRELSDSEFQAIFEKS
ncbi:MAG: pseudouridine synthase [Acutalibacteraceae bacterium]|jgi:16S rRNA pseudouridine516 synthase